MKLAYADPPYIGQAKKHYGPDAKEVNHAALIAHLREYDGWALSCSTPSLYTILPLLGSVERIGAWVKPFAIFKPGVNPGYCWEAVIFRPARKLGRDVPTVRDFHSENVTPRRGTHGAKPPGFSRWVFDLLAARAADDFTDVFPGSGAVTTAWEAFSRP